MTIHFPQTYIFIDAIDECKERTALLEVVDKIHQIGRSTCKVNLLVTSRPEREIRDAFHTKPTVSISEDNIRGDVERHVKAEVDTHPKLRRLSEEVKSRIIHRLVVGAKGMYEEPSGVFPFVMYRSVRVLIGAQV
jgi:hypothetical protein